MAETLANGTVIPQGSDPIHASGVQWGRNMGGSIDAQLGTKADKTDPRFSDARPPTAHTHALGDVTGLAARLAVIEYDSGWRDVSNGLRNGAKGTLHIRRVGSRVIWRIKNYAAGASHDFYIPPTGFLATSDANTYSAALGSVEGGFYRHQNGRLCRSIYDPPVFQGVWWESGYELAPGTATPSNPPGNPV